MNACVIFSLKARFQTFFKSTSPNISVVGMHEERLNAAHQLYIKVSDVGKYRFKNLTTFKSCLSKRL